MRTTSCWSPSAGLPVPSYRGAATAPLVPLPTVEVPPADASVAHPAPIRARRDNVPLSRRNSRGINPMAHITDIVETLDRLLSPGEFDDLGPNGLQVPGAPEVTRVVTGVSARRELSERAVAL